MAKEVKPTIVAAGIGGQLAAAVAGDAAKRQKGQAVAKDSSGEQSSVASFRPVRRPPVAMLTVLDDGASDGEVFRLKDARTVIGRDEADVRIPHDPLISSKHLEITRRAEGNVWRWFFKDLGSRNGTFFRVAKCRVRNLFVFLMGSCRYGLNVPNETIAGEPDREDVGTQGWAAVSLQALAQAASPHLVRFER